MAPHTTVAMRVVFFFFQAEDGIRDYKVTGVQTCALPILRPKPFEIAAKQQREVVQFVTEALHVVNLGRDLHEHFRRDLVPLEVLQDLRSEEHTSELQSPCNLVCRLLLEKKKKKLA